LLGTSSAPPSNSAPVDKFYKGDALDVLSGLQWEKDLHAQGTTDWNHPTRLFDVRRGQAIVNCHSFATLLTDQVISSWLIFRK
jgi:hypothetical protein